jgi:hypothetical protein
MPRLDAAAINSAGRLSGRPDDRGADWLGLGCPDDGRAHTMSMVQQAAVSTGGSAIASGHDACRALVAVAEEAQPMTRAEAATAAPVSDAAPVTAAAVATTGTAEKPVQPARSAAAHGSERAQVILRIVPVRDRWRHEISPGRVVVGSCRTGDRVVQTVPIGVGRAHIAQAQSKGSGQYHCQRHHSPIFETHGLSLTWLP